MVSPSLKLYEKAGAGYYILDISMYRKQISGRCKITSELVGYKPAPHHCVAMYLGYANLSIEAVYIWD